MGLILVDTNIVIYTIKGLSLIEPYLIYDFALSEISIIELLGVKNIEAFTLKSRQRFINGTVTYPFNTEIRELTIELKQKYSLKVPDAVIAATAIHYNQSLLTADKDFAKIKEVSSIIVTF